MKYFPRSVSCINGCQLRLGRIEQSSFSVVGQLNLTNLCRILQFFAVSTKNDRSHISADVVLTNQCFNSKLC